MDNDIILGQMTCPNCGIIRDTTTYKCTCGYNPLTGLIEEPTKVDFNQTNSIDSIKTFPDMMSEIRQNEKIRQNENWNNLSNNAKERIKKRV